MLATRRDSATRHAGAAGELRVLDLDVTSTESVDAAAAAVPAEVGVPDVVVHSAGQMFVGFTEAFTDVELTRQLDVNVVGIHRMNRAFLPAMRQLRRGLVVHLSSVAGRLGAPFFGVDHASRWALEGDSMALRGELASSGVDLVVVEPGPFASELFPSSPRPADVEGRVAGYPAAAHQALEGPGQVFDAMFADPQTPTDAGLVVERIDVRPGTRPFRGVVGVDVGVGARNAAVEPFDAGVPEAFGLTAFATLSPASEG